MKYLEEANNKLQKLLESEGAEVIVPDLTDFILYCLRNSSHKKELYNNSPVTKMLCETAIWYIEKYRKPIRNRIDKSKFYKVPEIRKLEDYAEEVVSLGNQYGEGWLLTAEMIELIKLGAGNIVCIQPFGCLPNHITGKGVIKKIRSLYKDANIVPIDYDPGASEVNQVNRIKLMLATAKEN